MRTLDHLIADVRHEAERDDFPIDRPVYEKAGKNPLDSILFAGSLAAPVCIFGRDLGKDEVALGQPLIGAGGKLVRQGLLRAFGGNRLEETLQWALLTNTVPYKPPGNKAYSEIVKARFRPFVTELLTKFWIGGRVICLGNEAYKWFAPYAEPGAADEFWNREDRYEAELPCVLRLVQDGKTTEKRIRLLPLPHPSPLNARWYGLFPAMLDARLGAIAK